MDNKKVKTPIEGNLMYFGIVAIIISIIIFLIGEVLDENGIIVFGMAVFSLGILLVIFSVVFSNTDF